MEKGSIAMKFPTEIILEAGKVYAWCACGLSKKQPFCDGTHKQGNLRPMILKAEKSESVWLCQCKQTNNAPFCDGTHNTL